MAKWMWIIAGPNGAGKSTFTNNLLANAPDLLKLNADERTALCVPPIPSDRCAI